MLWAAAPAAGLPAFVVGIPTSSTRGARLAAAKAGGANARAKLTFSPDHSVGVGQWLATEMMNRAF
jgi:hypothetical protein